MATIIKSVTFGQDPSCDVVIADPYMSNRHARAVQYDDGRVYLEDLGSTNGTTIIRGEFRITVTMPTRVIPGDVIRIGRTCLPWKVES